MLWPMNLCYPSCIYSKGFRFPKTVFLNLTFTVLGLASGQYPILSDLLSLIDNKLSAVPARQTAVQKELMLDDLRRLRNVRAVIQSIVKNYEISLTGTLRLKIF